jgi:hypothetical protein
MQSAIPRGEEEPGLEDQLRHTHKSDDIPFPLWNLKQHHHTHYNNTLRFRGAADIKRDTSDIANRGAISQTDQPAPGGTPTILHQTIASHIGLSNRWAFSTKKNSNTTPPYGVG